MAYVLGLTETSLGRKKTNELKANMLEIDRCQRTCLHSSQHIINKSFFFLGENLSVLAQWSFLDGKSGKYPNLGDKMRGLTWHYIHSTCKRDLVKLKIVIQINLTFSVFFLSVGTIYSHLVAFSLLP